MAVLDIQRRGQQIGRIRIGQQVSTGKQNRDGSEKMRPARLDTFRFTTGSRPAADAIAALYGGEVRDWNGSWEVITGESAIGVTVPPRDEVVSQHYEMWSKGGAQRRCDSQTEQLSGGPCLCPHASDPDDLDEVARASAQRAMLASQNPPKACKLVTRINVMIPDLPGLGVWRLDTGSYYAAVEIGDTAHLMQMARQQGVFLPAQLRIEQRSRVAGGQTKKFPVPVLEVLTTARQLVTGELAAGGMAAQLPPAPGEATKAITSGAAPKRPGPDEAAPPAKPAAAEPPQEDTPRHLADLVMVSNSRDELSGITRQAKDAGLLDRLVEIDGAHESIRDLIQARWDLLPPPANGAARKQAPEPPADPESGSLFDGDPEWEGQ